MRHLRVIALAAFVVAMLGAGPARAGAPVFELIDVHEINPVANHGKRVAAANCANDGTPTGTYSTTGWNVEGPGVAHFNPATVPSGLNATAVEAAIQASYDAWVGAPAYDVEPDSSVTKQTANRRDDVLFGRTGGSLATTYTWRWSDTGEYESDIVFNKGTAWYIANPTQDGCDETAGNRYDIANIGTHEAGHAYGLDHPPGARFETMYAYGFSGETLKRTPASGDLAGIAAIYP